MASIGNSDRILLAQVGATGACVAFLRHENYSYRPTRCLGQNAPRSSLMELARVQPFLGNGLTGTTKSVQFAGVVP